MITMRKGEHVRWYVMTMGIGFNFHTPHWHGNVVSVRGQYNQPRNIWGVSLPPEKLARHGSMNCRNRMPWMAAPDDSEHEYT